MHKKLMAVCFPKYRFMSPANPTWEKQGPPTLELTAKLLRSSNKRTQEYTHRTFTGKSYLWPMILNKRSKRSKCSNWSNVLTEDMHTQAHKHTHTQRDSTDMCTHTHRHISLHTDMHTQRHTQAHTRHIQHRYRHTDTQAPTGTHTYTCVRHPV